MLGYRYCCSLRRGPATSAVQRRARNRNSPSSWRPRRRRRACCRTAVQSNSNSCARRHLFRYENMALTTAAWQFGAEKGKGRKPLPTHAEETTRNRRRPERCGASRRSATPVQPGRRTRCGCGHAHSQAVKAERRAPPGGVGWLRVGHEVGDLDGGGGEAVAAAERRRRRRLSGGEQGTAGQLRAWGGRKTPG
eukprot:SAG11_NODE_4498_length_1874_cov_1.617465_2_plen_193_part_00